MKQFPISKVVPAKTSSTPSPHPCQRLDRMSEQSALGVGQAIAAADVSTFEGGFQEEHLELQPDEVAAFAAFDVD